MITQQSTSSHSAQAKLAFEIAQPGSVLASLDTELVIKTSKLQKIVLHMISEFKKGLVSDNEALKMLPSFVVKRPTGNELGTILALDLGGTNFRVCRVGLEGSGKIRMANAKFTVSEELKTGSGQALFDFFADCVASFCKEQGINVINPPSPVSMGFTFSFPVNQTALNAGSLIKWTKGFCASGVEGNDVVQLLQDSFHRKNIHVNVTAVVNDTVGTLIAHAYSDPQTYISGRRN